MKTTKAILILAGALCLLFSPVSTKANTITFDLNFEFSGGTSPSGSPPWISATFMDVSGGVQLTITSLLQSSSEFVGTGGISFNLDPSLNPNNLTFTYQSGVAASSISTGVDSFKADGDGFFDIRFFWPVSPPTARFNDSDTAVYLIAGISGLSASSFDFLSETGGGQGTFKAAAHIQGIPSGTGSGWIGPVAVPEPGILILLGIAMSAIGVAVPFLRKI
jgi:hypothetical protein